MVDKNWIKRAAIFACILPVFVFGQKSDYKTFTVKANGHFGYIIQHRYTMGHLVKGHIGGFELSTAIPSYGKHLWEQENNFPEKGISAHFYMLGNPEQLGNLFAVSPHFVVPLNKNIRKRTLHLLMGVGLAYATKRFHPIDNHKNNVISATVNGFVNFKFLWKWDISGQYRIEYGVSLAHASNGKAAVPNLGLNLGTLNLALCFKAPKEDGAAVSFPAYTDSSTKRQSKHEVYWVSSLGLTTIYPVGSRKYVAQTHTLGYYLNVRNTHKWGAGIDIYYNPANRVLLLKEDGVAITPEQNVQFGAKLGWAYNLGRFSFPLEMGYYFKTRYTDDGFFYHRLGIRYYCRNNLVVQLGLKAHWARADYFEYGIGYRLPLKKRK